MPARLDVVGIVVADMARSLAFYRRLGLEAPATADTEPHVEIALPGGLRLALDTQETIRSFDPEWQPASGGHRMSLAFRCDTPAEVDQVYGELTSDRDTRDTRRPGMPSGGSATRRYSTRTATRSISSRHLMPGRES